jgi:hypothetical protein
VHRPLVQMEPVVRNRICGVVYLGMPAGIAMWHRDRKTAGPLVKQKADWGNPLGLALPERCVQRESGGRPGLRRARGRWATCPIFRGMSRIFQLAG